MASFEWVPGPAIAPESPSAANAPAPNTSFQWVPPEAATPTGFPALDPNLVDQRTGAPAQVRFAVGSAEGMNDKLGTLRKYYPEAQLHPTDTNSLVFYNKGTNRWTQVNPPGLDWGDIPGVLPEVGEFGGGLIGGALAAVGTVPPAVVAAPPTGGASLAAPAIAIPLGYGLGAAAGREATQLAGKALFGTQDSRSLPQHLLDTATTVGTNAIFSDLSPAFRAVAEKLAPVKQGVVDAFSRLGVQPSAGQVTTNPMVKGFEKTLSYTPGGGGTMGRFAENQVDEIGQAASEIAKKFGEAKPTSQEAGTMLKEAGQAAEGRFLGRQNTLYDDAFAKIGSNTPAGLANLKAFRDGLAKEIDTAPETYATTKGVVLKEIDKALSDAEKNGGALPFDLLRKIRTNVGSENAGKAMADAPKDLRDARTGFYDALTDDIYGAAKAAGPDAEKALTLADRYTRFNSTLNMPTIRKLTDAGVAPEDLYGTLATSLAKGDSKLTPIWRQLSPADKGSLSATMLEQMGLAKAGAQDATGTAFSPSTFLTNWNKMSTEAKDMLFNGTKQSYLRNSLDDLATVAGSVKDMEKYANNSGTARGVLWGSLASSIPAAVIETATTGHIPVATLSTATALGPGAFGVSKLMTNPAFVTWISDATKAANTGALDVKQMIGRLAGVASFNPAIRSEVHDYVENLKANANAGRSQK